MQGFDGTAKIVNIYGSHDDVMRFQSLYMLSLLVQWGGHQHAVTCASTFSNSVYLDVLTQVCSVMARGAQSTSAPPTHTNFALKIKVVFAFLLLLLFYVHVHHTTLTFNAVCND